MLLAITAAGTLTALAGCPAADPCEVRPTSTNAAGHCVEADGELCDEDPCDSDDDGHGKPKTKKSKKRH